MNRIKVLVVCPDVVGEKMAGPGIRYTEIAKQLSKWFDVSLCAPKVNGSSDFPFELIIYNDLRKIHKLVKNFNFIIAQSLTFETVSQALACNCKIIYDLYNPLPIEALVGNVPTTEEALSAKDAEYNELLTHLLMYSRSGSYFVCANERQRDFWIGYLAANRVFMPTRYAGESIEQLVGLLPFGIQDSSPRHTRKVLRGVIPGIDKKSTILIWAGGIWDWFDPITAIKAIDEIKDTRPDIKLVFMGTTHPNKLVGRMSMTDKAIDLAEKLDIKDSHVFFIEGWIDYLDRANYLLEADAAVSLHQNNLETRFSFRTRILDHFWAKLPSIVTEGDSFAELIREENLGYVIGYSDIEGFKNAVRSVMGKRDRPVMEKNIVNVRNKYKWSSLVAGDIKSYIEDNNGVASSLPDYFINYYVDIASLGMLKDDSARYQLLHSRIDTYSNLSAARKLLLAQKRRTREYLLGEADL